MEITSSLGPCSKQHMYIFFLQLLYFIFTSRLVQQNYLQFRNHWMKFSWRSYWSLADDFGLNRHNNVLVTVVLPVSAWSEGKITSFQYYPCMFFIIKLISKALSYKSPLFWFKILLSYFCMFLLLHTSVIIILCLSEVC